VVGAGPAGLRRPLSIGAFRRAWTRFVIDSAGLGRSSRHVPRRIENYLGFPAGISGNELTQSRARDPGPESSTRRLCHAVPRPYSLEPGNGSHLVRLEDDPRGSRTLPVLDSPPVPSNRRLPLSTTSTSTRAISVFYAAGPPEAQLCGACTGGRRRGRVNSAGQAAVWAVSRKGALVTTAASARRSAARRCSDYPRRELDRLTVSGGARPAAEIAASAGHGTASLRRVSLRDGERLRFSLPVSSSSGAAAVQRNGSLTSVEARTGGRIHSDRRSYRRRQPPRDQRVPGVFTAGGRTVGLVPSGARPAVGRRGMGGFS